MELFVIRHGETDWNVAKRVQGRTDIPLNENGRAQAREAGEKLRAVVEEARGEGGRGDEWVVITSRLARAYETAGIICATAGLENEILVDERVLERAYGAMEGSVMERAKIEAIWDTQNVMEVEGGENVREFIARVEGFLKDIADKDVGKYRDKRVLVVTHMGVAMTIEAIIKGVPPRRHGNCEIVEFSGYFFGM
jgi:probable phosphoglycerate mutase